MENSRDWKTIPLLKEVGGLVNDGEEPDCLLVIALWNNDGNYDTKFWNVGMRVSEMVALLEIQKQKLIKYMESTGHDD